MTSGSGSASESVSASIRRHDASVRANPGSRISLSPPIPIPTPTPTMIRNARLALLAGLALLLAVTGCHRRGPPPLEEVIVGDWVDDFHAKDITFHPDGTWTALGRAGELGTYVLGPRCIFRKFQYAPMVVFEWYSNDGTLKWWDDDYGGSWVKKAGPDKRSRRAVRVKQYDPVVQSNMARSVVGVWVSEPRRWVMELGGDLRWSSTNWVRDWRPPSGLYVMGSDHEILLQREELLEGEYLRLEDDHLVHVGDDGATNVFHRVPTRTQAAHE